MKTLIVHLCSVAITCLSSFAAASDESNTTSVTIPVGTYDVVQTEQGHELSMEGFGRLLVPGMPNLPSKIFPIAIPPGRVAVDISYDLGEGITLPDTYNIVPTPLTYVIGQEGPAQRAAREAEYELNYDTVYGSDEAYPASVGEMVRTAHYRKYNLVDVRITPIIYNPLSGRLTYYPNITVHIDHKPIGKHSPTIIDNLEQCEFIASELILNYQDIQHDYSASEDAQRGLYDFVIVTLDSLTGAVAPLADWEVTKGRTVNVVTTTWINSNYAGYDLAEKIRNFLREKYPSGEWGIEDVLLVGHYDDVPMRRTEQNIGHGRPETDYYYAELSLPDSESWDADGDHRWGENTDPIDFYAEINIGRIPWSNPTTVQHICNKSVAYEQNSDPAFKKNILLLGAFFWDDDPNPRTDNAVLMEAKVNQPWMSDWTMTRMYEEGHSYYPMDYNLSWNNVRNIWSTGTYAFVNWAGHGSPTSSHIYHAHGAFVSNDTCQFLNDDFPSIIFADACSNSDTDHLNIGKAMLKQGGVGFLGATKVALGCPGWDELSDGSSQSLDYLFTTYVTSGEYSQGQAHQQALRDMYVNGYWSDDRYEMFEWGALWGNPNLVMNSQFADCNDNGIFDHEDITAGTSDDCNTNGRPDECEIDEGSATDCNENDLLDECDIAAGTSFDCNLNLLPDECDIESGFSDDCNDNGIPDSCDVVDVIHFNSGQLSPIGGSGYSQSYTLTDPVRCQDDVHLIITAFADLNKQTEYIDVELNGEFIGRIFENYAHDCPIIPDEAELVISCEDFNAAADTGQVTIDLFPTIGVWAYECDDPSYVTVEFTYFLMSDLDHNGNGIPDECECLADFTGDDQVNIDDIFAALGLWGACPDPCPPSCIGDLTGDCTINIDDIFSILGEWGECQ